MSSDIKTDSHTQAPVTTVTQSIVVDAPMDVAFKVFTEQFDRIKPREHNLLSAEIAETVFEPRVGGHVYDRGVDGSECRWARVLEYDPPRRVVISWDISPRWQLETDLDRTSEVEVQFVAEGDNRTRVPARAPSPRPPWRRLGHAARRRRRG